MKDVVNFSDSAKWVKAASEEMQSMKKNNEWELVDKDDIKDVLKSRWVFTRKPIGKRKARLVALKAACREMSY